jgi:hypothetical protein
MAYPNELTKEVTNDYYLLPQSAGAFPVRETISIEKICTAGGSKPRMGFHMMNLPRRLVDVFRIDFYGYECPDGQGKFHHRQVAEVRDLTGLTGSIE